MSDNVLLPILKRSINGFTGTGVKDLLSQEANIRDFSSVEITVVLKGDDVQRFFGILYSEDREIKGVTLDDKRRIKIR